MKLNVDQSRSIFVYLLFFVVEIVWFVIIFIILLFELLIFKDVQRN